MAVTVRHTGLPTDKVRETAVALHQVGHTGELRVGVDGPEKWTVETPNLTPNQFAKFVAKIVKITVEGNTYTLEEFIETSKSEIKRLEDEVRGLKSMVRITTGPDTSDLHADDVLKRGV